MNQERTRERGAVWFGAGTIVFALPIIMLMWALGCFGTTRPVAHTMRDGKVECIITDDGRAWFWDRHFGWRNTKTGDEASVMSGLSARLYDYKAAAEFRAAHPKAWY